MGENKWFWLSFADGSKPKGSQFLGVCIVEALNFVEAVAVSHRMKINPGGEAKGWEISEPDRAFANRLIQREEAEKVTLVKKATS